MSRSIDKCIDEIVDAFDGNIYPDPDGTYSSLNSTGKVQLRTYLTQLVFEIKEEIRNEINQ